MGTSSSPAAAQPESKPLLRTPRPAGWGVGGASALVSALILSFQEVILPKAWPRLLPPPSTLGWVCPLGGEEGHPTLSNPRGSQPRTEQDGGDAKPYKSCDLMWGCVPDLQPLPACLTQVITDVTSGEARGPQPVHSPSTQALTVLRPAPSRVGGGGLRTVHSPSDGGLGPPRAVGCSQMTDVLLAASPTSQSPLLLEAPRPLPRSRLRWALHGRWQPQCQGLGMPGWPLCGESIGQGSAAVLASSRWPGPAWMLPRVRALEVSAPSACLAGS